MVAPRDSLKDKGPSLYQALRRASQFVKPSRVADYAFWRTIIADSVDNDKSFEKPANSSFGKSFKLWEKCTRKVAKLATQSAQPHLKGENGRRFFSFQVNFTAAVVGRRFCTTENRRPRLVPAGVESGDLVCLLEGADVLHLLRPSQESLDSMPEHRLVGEYYVHGFMDGEALRLGVESQHITIV